MGKMVAPCIGRITDIAQRQVRVICQVFSVALGQRVERSFTFGRQGQEMVGAFTHAARWRLTPGKGRNKSLSQVGRVRLGWRGFFENHMRIRAAHPKGTDAGQPLTCGPRRPHRGHLHGARCPIDVRGWRLEM